MLYNGNNIYQLIDIMKATNYTTKTLIDNLNSNYPNLKLEDEKQLLTVVFA
jgi:hypothetical protein